MNYYIKESQGKTYIKITFQYNGRNLNFNDITDKMNINPSLTKNENDFPDVSKISGMARDIWEFSLGYNESLLVADELNKFLLIISNKVEIINKLKTIYNMKSILIISIQAYVKPYPVIPFNCIEFAYMTNTEIEFDPYYYEENYVE